MRLILSFTFIAFILIPASSPAFGQAGRAAGEGGQDTSRITSTTQTSNSLAQANDVASPLPAPEKQPVWIHLVGGGRIEAEEVTERAEGVWYRRGSLSTFIDRARVTRVEREAEAKPKAQPENTRVTTAWNISDAGKIESFYMNKFGRRLPLTAYGQSVLHTSWGFDHRNSMDVGLHPDSREGRALIEFLRAERIPFQAFRGAVPGMATGPHIHIGRPSHRITAR